VLPILRFSAAATSLAIVLALSACGSLDDETPVTGITTVEVRDNNFRPAVIQVPAGTEVTWDFTGRQPHNVIGDGWGSDVLSTGTYSHRFEAPGTFDYTCTLHGNMDGRVIVTANESAR